MSTHVKLILRDLVERARVSLEVLGQDADGVAQHHLGDEESAVLAKAAIVKDEQELDALVKGLDAVGHARGEEPDVTGAHIVHEGGTLRVDSGYPHAALGDQRPLVRRVPMQLAVGVGAKTHVHAGHGLGAGEDVYVLLARPPRPLVGTMAVVREAQRPHGLVHGAIVGAGRCVDVRVDTLVVVRPRARVGAAIATTYGLGRVDAVEV